MNISFARLPISGRFPDEDEVMLFEKEYPENLRETYEDKAKIYLSGEVYWMWVDSIIAGEIISISPFALHRLSGENTPNIDNGDIESQYIYSTTIVKNFQGQGYGRLLKVFHMEMLRKSKRCTKILGHATSPAAIRLNQSLGATFYPLNVYPNWYGSRRTAHYYEIKL